MRPSLILRVRNDMVLQINAPWINRCANTHVWWVSYDDMPFAVIVLASDTAHRYLVALGGSIKPRLLDLINGHHFLARIIVKHLILLFPFYWFLVLCWIFCFCLLLGLLLLAGTIRLYGLPSNIFSISAFLTNAIRLLNREAFNLPLATSL